MYKRQPPAMRTVLRLGALRCASCAYCAAIAHFIALCLHRGTLSIPLRRSLGRLQEPDLVEFSSTLLKDWTIGMLLLKLLGLLRAYAVSVEDVRVLNDERFHGSLPS